MLLSTILQKILIFLCSCFSSVVPKLHYICKSLSHFPEHTPWLYESIYQFIVSSAAFYKGTASCITQSASSNQLYFSIWEHFRKPSVNLSGFLSFPPSPDKSENTKALLPVYILLFIRVAVQPRLHPVTNAPVIYSNDSSPEAGGTLQFDKVCIKVSLPSPPSPWILFCFSTEYILECYFQKAFELRWYLRNLTTENLLFIEGKIIFFPSASIKHGSPRKRDVGYLFLKSNNVGLGGYSACFATHGAPSSFRRNISLRSKVNNFNSTSISLHWRGFSFGFCLGEKA